VIEWLAKKTFNRIDAVGLWFVAFAVADSGSWLWALAIVPFTLASAIVETYVQFQREPNRD
jgi:hypothetical protein